MLKYYDFAFKKSFRNCIICKHPGCEIACCCGIAFYCTVDCQSRNTNHRHRCSKIQQLMKECATDYEVIPKASTEEPPSNDQIFNVKKWQELIILLIKESKCNNVSLRLTFHLLQMLVIDNPGLYRNLIMLLPEVALMLNELELCHNLICHSFFEKRFFGVTMVQESLSAAVIHKPLHAILRDSDPIHCDKILILNLLMVKLVFVQRICSIHQLQRQWNGLPHAIFDLISKCLGVPKEWKKVKTPIMERQCMDMVKLLYLIDAQFVPYLVRSCQSSSLPILLRVLPSSNCTESLRYLLFLCRVRCNKFVLDFLNEVSSDIRLN
mmetsp:Transcript_1175/g.2124  ORF Transcript_1175/g.2124 Transcript_1175/m.2124 type:complete len:323 (+) Transcript_1175:1002-1970(+)